MTKPTRLTALASIAGTLALATGTVGALALQSATAEGNPDAELIALCDRYLKEWEEYGACLDREDAAQEIAWANEPPCPPELCEPLEFADGPKPPAEAARRGLPAYWSRETLECYAKPDSTSWRNEITEGEGIRTLKMTRFPVPDETRERCRELLKVHDRWEEEIDAGEATYLALKSLSPSASEQCSELLEKIIEHKPERLPASQRLPA